MFRLNQKRQFDQLIKKGKQLKEACYLMFYLPNSVYDARLGIMVSKRHCPLAVRRNRIKRLIRELFRLQQAAFLSYDVVILLRSDASALNDSEHKQCLQNLFAQLKRHCSASFSN